MRQRFEELEHNTLAPYAQKSAESKGRVFSETPSSTRTCFQRDRDRIIHARSFRRLKDKTQVFLSGTSDHYRSRLTHTIEVSQISRHLARLLSLNEDLCECIALAHDLGHSPFGHSGERELNRLLFKHGGFEHNLQSLKIVETLEKKYPNFPGLNLTFEVKEGLKKHFTPWDKPQKTQSSFISLEAQVVNLSDEIAYNNHDLDDGLSSGLLQLDDCIRDITLFREAHTVITEEYSALQKHELKHLINSSLISSQVTDVFRNSSDLIRSAQPNSIEQLQKSTRPLVCFSPSMQEKNDQLRRYLSKNFYRHPSIDATNKHGQSIIRELFSAISESQNLLPESYRRLEKEQGIESCIGDYIAGMTDRYATALVKAL